MAFSTNFKHERETRTDYRDRRKAEKQAEQVSCYQAVDLRDVSICRVTGVYVTAGATDPHKRKEHHHMLARSLGGLHELANVITISAYIHQLIHAGKLRLSGDANLQDADGKFCGVTVERQGESGFITVGLI